MGIRLDLSYIRSITVLGASRVPQGQVTTIYLTDMSFFNCKAF